MTSSEFVAIQSSVSVVEDNKTISRQWKGLLRQQQHATVRNSIMTKENIVATKLEKNPKKNVATLQKMSRYCGRDKGKNICSDKEIYVASFFRSSKE